MFISNNKENILSPHNNKYLGNLTCETPVVSTQESFNNDHNKNAFKNGEQNNYVSGHANCKINESVLIVFHGHNKVNK